MAGQAPRPVVARAVPRMRMQRDEARTVATQTLDLLDLRKPMQGFEGRDTPSDELINACVRCGFCLTSCPTYVETRVETSSPRGRIYLMKSVSEGRLDITSPGFVHQMYECLD